MVKKGKHFSGKVAPLFASMLVQPIKDEGAPSERPSEAQPTPFSVPTSEIPIEPQTDSSPAHTSKVPIEQQNDPSPRPSPSTILPDSIPETSGGNLGGHSSSDKSLSGTEGELTLQSVYDICLSLCAQQRLARKKSSKKQWVHKESVSKQGMKFDKGESSVQRDPLFDEIPEDTVDYMETENAQDVGRTREIVDEDKEIDENMLSTEDVLTRIEADRLLAEKLQEQERKQFTIEERAKFLHDTIAAQRKFLSQQRSEAIRNRPPTKNQLRNQMMTYLKHVGNFKHSELKTKKFEEIQALYEKIKRYQDEIPEGFDIVLWGDLMVMFNPDDENEFWNSQQDWNIVSWKLHSSSGVHTLVTEAGLVIHMLVEKKYPLRKKVLVQMLELKLESEEDSTMALKLIRFIKKLLAELEPEDFDGNEEDL
ncbi:hypothetical protein Tco_1161236 [Tanacetum coccineum]